jgi:hypothetical protein
MNMRKTYQSTIVLLFVLLMVRGVESSAPDKHWLAYGPEVVELEGTLIIEQKYGPPNYGENPKTDTKWKVPILVLATPINVRGNPQDVVNSESVEGISRIQLRFFNVAISSKQFIGKRVRVKGTLSHDYGTSGHQGGYGC